MEKSQRRTISAFLKVKELSLHRDTHMYRNLAHTHTHSLTQSDQALAILSKVQLMVYVHVKGGCTD